MPEAVKNDAVFKRMARLYEKQNALPNDGHQRDLNLTHRIDGQRGFPRPHTGRNRCAAAEIVIIRARNGSERVYLEMTGDKETFFQFN